MAEAVHEGHCRKQVEKLFPNYGANCTCGVNKEIANALDEYMETEYGFVLGTADRNQLVDAAYKVVSEHLQKRELVWDYEGRSSEEVLRDLLQDGQFNQRDSEMIYDALYQAYVAGMAQAIREFGLNG